MYERLLNLVDNDCLQYYNELILLQEFINEVQFHHLLSLFNLLLVLLSIFIVPGVKVQNNIPLNVILFSLLFIYFFTEGLLL